MEIAAYRIVKQRYVASAFDGDGKSPVLKVPSVIIPDGSNYLLNIGHPDFSKIRIGEPMPMSFDPRLLKE